MRSILQIMDYAAPYKGNFITALECLEDFYNSEGRTVYLLPEHASEFGWVKNMISDNKKVYFIEKQFFSRKVSYSFLLKLNKIIIKENVFVIHTHFIEYNYSLFLYKKLFRRSIKIVSNYHNHYFPSGRLRFVKNKVIKHSVDVFIGDSKSVSSSLRINGIEEKRIITINNSIHFPRLDTGSSIQFSNNNKSVLMFGYPWHRKGVDVVARAMYQLNLNSSDPVILGIAQAGCYDSTKSAIISTLGYFPEWVKLLDPTDDLAAYYNAADIFISAGREEGLSYSPLEAAYCSCLLICSDIPGNPLDIPGMYIYDVEDNSNLLSGIEKLLNLEAEERKKIKELQKEYVLKNYSIEDWLRQVVNIYYELN